MAHCHHCGAFTGRNPSHPCPKFRIEPDLPSVAVTVIPPRSDDELAESFRRWRRSIQK